MLKILCLQISLLAILMIGEKVLAQTILGVDVGRTIFVPQIELGLPKGMAERLSGCHSGNRPKTKIAREILGCVEKPARIVDLDPNEDLFVSLAHPNHWDPKLNKALVDDLITALPVFCPARPLNNPNPDHVTLCQLPKLMAKYRVIEELIENQESYKLHFQEGHLLKDAVTVGFVLDVPDGPRESPLATLSQYIMLRYAISEALPQMASAIHRLATSDGRQTWVFDTVIFPRLNIYFSGESMAARLAAFEKGLICTNRTYVVPKCHDFVTKMKAAVTNLRIIIKKNAWYAELSDPASQLNTVAPRDAQRFVWDYVRTQLIGQIKTWKTNLPSTEIVSQYYEGQSGNAFGVMLKSLETQMTEIFAQYEATETGNGAITFAKAAYDYFEIVDALGPVTTIVNPVPQSKELTPLIEKAVEEIGNITITIKTALDYSNQVTTKPAGGNPMKPTHFLFILFLLIQGCGEQSSNAPSQFQNPTAASTPDQVQKRVTTTLDQQRADRLYKLLHQTMDKDLNQWTSADFKVLFSALVYLDVFNELRQQIQNHPGWLKQLMAKNPKTQTSPIAQSVLARLKLNVIQMEIYDLEKTDQTSVEVTKINQQVEHIKEIYSVEPRPFNETPIKTLFSVFFKYVSSRPGSPWTLIYRDIAHELINCESLENPKSDELVAFREKCVDAIATHIQNIPFWSTKTKQRNWQKEADELLAFNNNLKVQIEAGKDTPLLEDMELNQNYCGGFLCTGF